jgi:hypothetical protein
MHHCHDALTIVGYGGYLRTAEIVMRGIHIPRKNPASPSSRHTSWASRGTDIGVRDACRRLLRESSYVFIGRHDANELHLKEPMGLTGYPARVDRRLAEVAQTTVLFPTEEVY